MKLRHLLLERKVKTNLDSILKSRDITLPTKVHLVKAMVFPVVMYGCESWTVKKAEHRRTDAFELWCWRRLLRVPWTARRSNQSILKEISPGVHWKDWCWSWNSNTLATWCEELTHLKRLWCQERLKAGGEGDDRGWDGWMASPTQWTWVWAGSSSWWRTGKPGMLQFMGSQRVGHNRMTELNLQHKSIHLREGLWTFKGLQTWPALVQSTQELCERGYCPRLLLLAFLQGKELKLREVQRSIKKNSHCYTSQGHHSHSCLSKSVHVLFLSTIRLLLLGHQ